MPLALSRLLIPALLALAASMSACGSRGTSCSAGDCDGECTSTGECVSAGSAVDILITWTVEGERPTPAQPQPCEGIAELEVDLLDDTLVEEIVYAPVPCDIGQIRFFDMPPRLDRIRVLSFDASGGRIGRVSAPIPDGETDVEIDVELL